MHSCGFGQVGNMGEVFARRYELLEPIAEGGMGSVWMVRDHQDGTVCAAKLLRHSDAGSLLRFMREQSTRIHHAHVVTPKSWVGEDDTVLFTMPLVRGGSVAALVGDWGALPEAWVRVILDQTLDALSAVHAAGVIHRDVKSANLLLEPSGSAPPHVRLTDFGIAAPLDQPRLTAATTALGTRGYAAPEQLDGADPDPRQDLFALATVGLEMLIGHPPPFTTEELPATPLGGLLAEARNPDPSRRPDSAEAMRSSLRELGAPVAWDPAGVEVLDQFAPGAPPPSPSLSSSPPPSVSEPTLVLSRSDGPPALWPVLLLLLVGVGLLVVSGLLLLG